MIIAQLGTLLLPSQANLKVEPRLESPIYIDDGNEEPLDEHIFQRCHQFDILAHWGFMALTYFSWRSLPIIPPASSAMRRVGPRSHTKCACALSVAPNSGTLKRSRPCSRSGKKPKSRPKHTEKFRRAREECLKEGPEAFEHTFLELWRTPEIGEGPTFRFASGSARVLGPGHGGSWRCLLSSLRPCGC